PFIECWNAFLAGDYEMTIFGWVGLHDPSFMSNFLHSNGRFNTGSYSNLALDNYLDLAIESPIHQEREYYFKLVQTEAYVDAPYLLLPESPFYYPRANHVASLVRLSRNGRPSFNYSASFDQDIHIYSNIPISSKAVYFPFADALISRLDNQNLEINLTMTYNLDDILPSSKGTGKFWLIQVSNQEEALTSRFRCYYDPYEILDLSLDKFYRYNENSRSWSPLQIFASNSSLRYIEVELPGGSHLLSFGKQIIMYKFLPIISLLFGSVLLFAVLIVFYNQLQIIQFKRRYNL
ncbi:MAG: hypothetical protein ACFFAU_21140, partial [Candidatus Hodarchaeota archaeon]